MIDLDPKILRELKDILAREASDCEARIFGSRITGKAKAHSDIDLALVSSGPMDWRRIEKIKQAFSESNIPFMVDVLDWHSLSDQFKHLIEQRYEVLQVNSNR